MKSWGTPTPGIGKKTVRHLQLRKSVADDPLFWQNEKIMRAARKGGLKIKQRRATMRMIRDSRRERQS